MFGLRWMAASAFSVLVVGNLAAASPMMPRSVAAPAVAGGLTVMTYNVAGLPFPVKLNRTAALQQIGLRLSGLRREGRQPHVVLLQEAFTPEAKAIADLAGYRYAVAGPEAGDAIKGAAMPGEYRAAANWRKGEAIGKWVDSGLLVLSDYPIVGSTRMAFAEDACAGFDCLAAKGVLLTWIKVPGQAHPIAIADTHLNSRRSTGVADTRSNAAFAAQFDQARRFVSARVGARTSVVFGGDFNIGHDPQRLAHVGPGPLAGAVEATAAVARTGDANTDVQAVIARAKDKQYFRAGAGKALRIMSLDVPFGIADGGYGLSDHLGYVVTYALR